MSTDIQDIVAEQQQKAEETWLREYLKGPTRTRWETLPPQVGDSAPDLELPDTTGKKRHLSEWWALGPIHLIFLRHHGCGCLADRFEALRSAMALIERAGARTVGVCQAEPERSRKIAERRGYEFPMLSDPTRIGYAAFGLLDGEVASVLNDDAWEPGDLDTAQKLAASRHGTERALVDHAWQLPGEFIIAQGGRIMLTHRAQFCGDFPPTAILLGAVAQAGD